MFYKIRIQKIFFVTYLQHEFLHQNHQFFCQSYFTYICAAKSSRKCFFSQVPNMNNTIPDLDPLFDEKVSLLKCLSLCVHITLYVCVSFKEGIMQRIPVFRSSSKWSRVFLIPKDKYITTKVSFLGRRFSFDLD